MNDERFSEAIAAASHDGGIGTLGEKTLHAVLKYYIEPDPFFHEVSVGGRVADIYNEDGITEIQTRSLERLIKKLPSLLEKAKVTVVFPIPYRKWISWIDPATGELSKRRRSPKTGRLFDALYELGKLKKFIREEGFSVKIMLIDTEEHRNLDGWGNGGKRGSSRNERFPLRLESETDLKCPEDYRVFLPEDLASPFTIKEYEKAAKVSYRSAVSGVAILREAGIVSLCGKRGRENLLIVNRESQAR